MPQRSSVMLLAVATGVLFAQAVKQPEIEAASVKPGTPGKVMVDRSSSLELNLENTQLRLLITQAFDVRLWQLVNAPDWLSSETWSVEMKSTVTATPQQMNTMLQAVLADRFHLSVHRETRILPIFELLVTKDGHKLRAAREDEEESIGVGGGGTLSASNSTLSDLTSVLISWLGRPVIDKTGLQGHYDFRMKWDPDSDDDIAAPPDLASVLGKQLGLELKAAKGPLEVLVIDHVEKPSPN